MTIASDLNDLYFGKALAGIDQLHTCLSAAQALRGQEARDFIDSAMDTCRRLYTDNRALEALPTARTCDHLAGILDDSALLIRTATALGNVLSVCNELAAATKQHVRVLQRAVTADDKRNIAASLTNIGTLDYHAGLPQLAVPVYGKVVYGALAAADAGVTYSAAINLAQCHLALGHIPLGLKSIQIARDLETAITDPFPLSVICKTHIRLLVLSGQLDKARPVVAKMTAIAKQHPVAYILLETLLARGSYEMACGNIERGRGLLLEALDLAHDIGHEVPYVLLALAQGFAKAGRPDKAGAYLLQLAQHMSVDVKVPPLPPQVTFSDEEGELLMLLGKGRTFKQIAREMIQKNMSESYWQTKASRLYGRLGAHNSVEACNLLRDYDQANFPHKAWEKDLIVASGKRHVFLADSTRALICQKYRPDSQWVNVGHTKLDQSVIAFNVYQYRGDKPQALHIAAAINQQLTIAEDVVEAGAEATALACKP